MLSVDLDRRVFHVNQGHTFGRAGVREKMTAKGSLSGRRERLPHDAIVFVGDGQRALFLRNNGDEKFPNLVVEHVFVDDNPPTHEQGTDRPGRAFKRASTNRRSSVAATDWHEIEKHRFARQVAAAERQAYRDAGERTATCRRGCRSRFEGNRSAGTAHLRECTHVGIEK